MERRLLVTGIPGTGKTTLGRHLHASDAFEHVDMEDDATRARFREDRDRFVADLPEPVVVTWGFHPLHDTRDILYFKRSGYRLVWLDGDRPAALREFIRRGSVPEPLFYLQLWNIESRRVVEAVAPDAIVTPFDPSGRFRKVEDVTAEVLRVLQ